MEQLDLGKLEKALIYVNRIADGKNPVNNMPADDDAVLNDPNVIRCMFFVKEALTAIKNNGGVIGRPVKIKKKDFPLETLSEFHFEEKKTITKFVEQLNDKINQDEYEKLSYKTITDWLKKNDYLQEVDDEKLGKKVTLTTEKGRSVEITHALQTNLNGSSYYRVEYDKTAQEFIVGKLPAILSEAAVQIQKD